MISRTRFDKWGATGLVLAIFWAFTPGTSSSSSVRDVGGEVPQSLWQQSVVGKGNNWMYGVAIGQGRNDGVVRVYGGNMDNHAYEFTFGSGAWSTMDIGNSSRGDGITSVTIGPGRYDGVHRVYASEYWNYDITNLDEFTYSGAQWSRFSSYFSYKIGYDVALGVGRNDGENRVYMCGGYSGGIIVELTYGAGTFSATTLATTPDYVRGLAVGNGRNDNHVRVYGASLDGKVYESSYSGSTWTTQAISVVSSALRDIAVGYGRNDGVSSVYVASVDGHIYELSYQNGSWNKTDVGYGGMKMYGVAVGDGRDDGVQRVYGANEDGHIYEFSYANGSWSKDDVGVGTSQMLGIAIGAGRNDGINRIYGANYDSNVYEFEYRQQPKLTVTKAGSGTGTITSVPAGIDCGSSCSARYADGTTVTLTATATTPSTFTGWSGDCGNGTNPTATVVMNANKTCTATFKRPNKSSTPVLLLLLGE
jgi:uncharacterized repeat protein (TIGR02543 family)